MDNELNLPRGAAVVIGDGSAKFASVRPLKTEKSHRSIRVVEVPGTVATTAASEIDI